MDFKKLFKFRSFSEQIANVRIRVKKRYDQPDDGKCYFHEALLKWRQLNCTDVFCKFFSEVERKCESLAQLVHHKDTVVESLKQQLSKSSEFSYEPLLDLVVQLARDLQAEFYPFFKEFFFVLVSLSDCQDATKIECVFTTIAHLFDFLWRHMLADLGNIYKIYSESLLYNHQKPHIKQFAVESFGFLLRKVRNVDWLCDLVLGSLSKRDQLVDGVGQLLFEVCRGVKGRMHTYSKKILPVLFMKLGDEQFVPELVFECLKRTVQLVAEYVKGDNAVPLWDALLGVFESVCSSWQDQPSDAATLHLTHLIHLIGILVSLKDGSRIAGPERLCQDILQLLQTPSLPSSLLTVLLHLCVSLLASLPCEGVVKEIVLTVFTRLVNIQEVLEFCLELASHGRLHQLGILPQCMLYCDAAASTSSNHPAILLFLTQLSLSLQSIGNTHSLTLLYSTDPTNIMKMCQRVLQPNQVKDPSKVRENDWSQVWAVLKILQFIRIMDTKTMRFVLKLFHSMWSELSSHSPSHDFVVVFAQCMELLVATLPIDALLNEITLDGVRDIVSVFPAQLCILQAVLQYLSAVRTSSSQSILTSDHLVSLLEILQQNMTSPIHHVRLVTLQILNLFDQLRVEGEGGVCEIVRMCLRAEETPATLECYRDKLMWLSHLKCTSQQLPQSYRQVPLRYLLGTLYVNFCLVWEPVCEFISSYCSPEHKAMFWTVFTEVLESVSAKAATGNHGNLSSPVAETTPTLSGLFTSHVDEMVSDRDDRPDHTNCRVLLWKCLELVPSAAEQRGRVLVPLLLDFVESEYGIREMDEMVTQNIGKVESQGHSSASGGAHDDEQGEKNTTEEERTEQKRVMETEAAITDNRRPILKAQRRGKSGREQLGMTRTLKVMLTVFSKFRNSKSLFRQEKVWSLCLKLLMHHDLAVQGLALSCLCTYKPPYLLPYKENLERLISDESFQEELPLFSVSSESYVVAETHRQELVPILVRILYGRLQHQAKSRLVGGAKRRSNVLRFLATCEQEEIAEFVQLNLISFQNLSDEVSCEAVVPLKRQIGFLNLTQQLLQALKEKLEPHLTTIMPTLLTMASHCAQLLSTHRDKIAVGFISSLKDIRQLVINLLQEFLDVFPSFSYPSFHDRLLEVAVWPQLARLPHECVQHPTPLLRLLFTWSLHPELSVLFALPVPAAPPSHSILYYVTECLFAEGVSEKVTIAVVDLVLSLLGSQEDKMEEDGEEDEVDEAPVAYGTSLVKPLVPRLLQYISVAMKKNKSGSPSRGGDLQREFLLLSKIGQFLEDPAEAEQLLVLLLPFLLSISEQQKVDKEQVLTAVDKLVHLLPTIPKCYRQLSKLFQLLVARNQREILCKIFQTIGEKNEIVKETSRITVMLNSWSATQLEEPDYELRLDGFAAGKQLLRSGLPDSSLIIAILPILHNALFFVHQTEDMSIRDSSSSFISELISTTPMTTPTSDTDPFQCLVIHTLVPSIKRGLRSKRQVTIHEFIDLLSRLVRGYPSHKIFSELSSLTNPDPEADILQNIRHIQLHRRTRALHRLSNVISEGKLSQATLTGYLLPLASNVVFSPLSAREHNLLSEAVNVLSAMAGQLQWSAYCHLLKHYLRQLSTRKEIHRNIIRAVVAILDSFHFKVTEEHQDSEPPAEQQEEEENDEDEKMVDETLASSLPQRIHSTILNTILPGLESCLTKESEYKFTHHKAEVNEEAEMLRVPVAMAMTKLLLTLPESSLHAYLPGLLLKVCKTLKNRSRDVRAVARDTLLKMAHSLGPRYLQFIVKELKESLTRGYQLHVLAYTIHHLLEGLSPILKPGDLDSSLDLIIQVLLDDVFGTPAEEREAVVFKIPESRSQSLNSFELLARFLSPTLLPSLLEPVKEMLQAHLSSKVATLVEEVFRRAGYGVLKNTSFTVETVLVFVYKLLNNTVAQQTRPKPGPLVSSAVAGSRPPDCRLLSPNPLHIKPCRTAAASAEGSVPSHISTITMGFALHLLHSTLKRATSKMDSSSAQTQLEMLDPFVPLLTNSLTSSQNVKLLSRSLHCVSALLRLPLPALEENIATITTHVFEILQKYARFGSVGANRELIFAAFKAVTTILQYCTDHTITESELKILLSFIEEDIHDYQRQSTAYPLLKAILSRKLVVKEMYDVMMKVSEQCVSADSETVRGHARQAIVQFMMDYPLGKRLNKYLDFFVTNLNDKIIDTSLH